MKGNGKSTGWTAKLQLDWLPLPQEVVDALELKEGDEFDLEVEDLHTVILRKRTVQEKSKS